MSKQTISTHVDSVRDVPVIAGTALFTIKQVAEFLQVQPSWVQDHINNKELKIIKFGDAKNSLVRIKSSDLFEFIDSKLKSAINSLEARSNKNKVKENNNG